MNESESLFNLGILRVQNVYARVPTPRGWIVVCPCGHTFDYADRAWTAWADGAGDSAVLRHEATCIVARRLGGRWEQGSTVALATRHMPQFMRDLL